MLVKERDGMFDRLIDIFVMIVEVIVIRPIDHDKVLAVSGPLPEPSPRFM